LLLSNNGDELRGDAAPWGVVLAFSLVSFPLQNKKITLANHIASKMKRIWSPAILLGNKKISSPKLQNNKDLPYLFYLRSKTYHLPYLKITCVSN